MRQTTWMMAATLLGLAAAPAQAQEKTPGRSQVFSSPSPSGGLTRSDRSGGAQNGLLAPTSTTNWPQWQGRLALGLDTQTLNDSPRWRSGSLLGDYYFDPRGTTSPTSPMGGFRATSGLLIGNMAPRLLTGLGPNATSGYGLGLTRAVLGQRPEGWPNDETHSTASYWGLGYTLLSLSGGWGLSADIGLATLARSTAALRPPGAKLGQSSLEDNLRDLRLTPLLQLGLSYSF
jgi:hypothetical protein